MKPREKKDQKDKKKTKKKIGDVNLKAIWFVARIAWKVYKSFKIKKLTLNIDTGDVIRNAYLIPVFSINFQEKINLSVNFFNKNEFIFHIETRLFTIIIGIISTFIKYKLKQ